MNDDRRRMRRQVERERKVRLMRLYIGIGVAVVLFVAIGSGLLIRHLQNTNGGVQEVQLSGNDGTDDSEELDADRAETEDDDGSDGDDAESESGDAELISALAYDYEELSDLIEDELAGENVSGTWSVYVKDLTAGQSISINSQSMYAASLIKLYVMMSSYENMDDLITNYCSINHTDELTAAATINDRLYTMIVYSRNESYNELVRLHSSSGSFTSGCRLVNSYIAANGFAGTGVYSTLHPSDSAYETTGEGTNHTTVEDCGELLEAIYNGTCVSEEASEAMLELLLQQDTTTKIPAGIPEGILVANKTGETDEESHDAAIVFGEETDYILCVMSTGVDVMGVGNADTLIKNISALVYEFLN